MNIVKSLVKFCGTPKVLQNFGAKPSLPDPADSSPRDTFNVVVSVAAPCLQILAVKKLEVVLENGVQNCEKWPVFSVSEQRLNFFRGRFGPFLELSASAIHPCSGNPTWSCNCKINLYSWRNENCNCNP